MKNYFEILNIDITDDFETIKKAYHKKALETHPDKNSDKKEAEAGFKIVGEAYAILSNEDTRKAHIIALNSQNNIFSNKDTPFKNVSTTLFEVNTMINEIFNNPTGRLMLKEGQLRDKVADLIEKDSLLSQSHEDLHERFISLTQLIFQANYLSECGDISPQHKSYLPGIIERATHTTRYLLFYLVWKNYPAKSAQETLDEFKWNLIPNIDLFFGGLSSKKNLIDFYKETDELKLLTGLNEPQNFDSSRVELRKLEDAIKANLKKALDNYNKENTKEQLITSSTKTTTVEIILSHNKTSKNQMTISELLTATVTNLTNLSMNKFFSPKITQRKLDAVNDLKTLIEDKVIPFTQVKLKDWYEIPKVTINEERTPFRSFFQRNHKTATRLLITAICKEFKFDEEAIINEHIIKLKNS